MLKIQIKPIKKWIGKETEFPKRSQFKATYSKTKQLLEKELFYLDAIESTQEIQMFIRPENLRRDGELRADARPYRPGVILSFSVIRAGGEPQTLSYPCDAFDDWQDNLRAIALSLEALRKVARYGVFSYADMVERLALPSAEGKVSTAEAAADFICSHSNFMVERILSDRQTMQKAYREAVTNLHPDKGGTVDDFQKLQEAREVLEKYFI